MKNDKGRIPAGSGVQASSLRARGLALLLGACILPAWLFGQAVPSALLDLESTNQGFLLPRMTQAQRESIQNPASGLMIFNLTSLSVEINLGSPSAPYWRSMDCIGTIEALDCSSPVITGELLPGQAASGVTASIPYTGGNGGGYNGQAVSSTGVTGLTASLATGGFAYGAGSLTYSISGTPSGSGTAVFALNVGGQSCSLQVTVPGIIGLLGCGTAVLTGSLMPGQLAQGVTVSVPYTGGNGGPHSGQTVASSGVAGLTATLPAGSFANGNGSLPYAIAGTPAGFGMASFALDIGEQACTLVVDVCGAYVAQGQWKMFKCHNLAAANTAADPFTPSWEIIGGYWQWGCKGPGSSQWLNTNTEHFAHGPNGPGAGQANEAAFVGWSGYGAGNGAWSDATKTVNDPCPPGYRVPAGTQLDGLSGHNAQGVTGAWHVSATNYSSGRSFGPGLMLPAAGWRSFNALLEGRGGYGAYWSSTEATNDYARRLLFGTSNPYVGNTDRRNGNSLRCIAE